MKNKLTKKLLSALLALAMLLSLVPAASLTASAVSVAEEWTTDITVTETRTINGNVLVNSDITLTIAEDVTLTVNGRVIASGMTLTADGGGTLVVNGVNGPNGTDHNPVGGVYNGTAGYSGGPGISGNIIVNGASVVVNGGNGGNGGSSETNGAAGGNGGNAIDGDVTCNSGSLTAVGGRGGNGGVILMGGSGSNGSSGRAITGTITGTVKESDDNVAWADVTGATSTKRFVQVEPTAYAAYLPLAADDAAALAGKVVEFNGYKWYIIEDNSTSATEGTVTLFAKDTIGSSRFDNSSNVYSGSMVKSYLDNLTAEGGAFADVADAIVSTDLEDVTVTGAKLWLLSKDEVITTYKLSTALNKCSNAWWLRTPVDPSYVVFVNGESGSVDNTGNLYMNTYGVRPALKLDLSKVEFDSETKTFALPTPHTHDDITFTAWESTDSLPTEAGNYYLTNNVVLAESWEVPEGTTNLCLNGKSVTTTEDTYLFVVGTWSDSDTTYALNLFDDTGEGFISKESSTNYSDCVFINKNGNFTMNSGKITNSSGTGVYVNKGGKFTMNGGEISHNSGYIGGVYVPKGAEFTMNGGEITGNSGVEFGGVYIEGGYADPEGEEYCKAPAKFNVSGKVNISGNTVGTNECNVFLGRADGYKPGPEYNSVITLTGALDEDSVIGVTMIDSGVFTAGFDGKGAITNFTSDDSTYKIKTQGKELKLSNHEHSFTYSADGATITAVCSAEECPLEDLTATLTIGAPTLTTYGQTGEGVSAEATITDENNIRGDAAVSYYKATKNEGDDTYTKSGDALAAAPADAGDYIAEITLGTGEGAATASVVYTIAKADPTANAPAGLTATYGQTLADVTLTNPSGNTAGTWAWVDDTQSVGNVVSPAATFKANFTPTDTNNYNVAENVDVTVTVGKADPTYTVPAGLNAAVNSLLSAVALPDGWSWKDGTQNVGDFGDKTFKATFTPEDTANYNVVSDIDVPVGVRNVPEYDIPDGLTAGYGDTLADVLLPDGWTWDDSTLKVGDLGDNVHKATFTPEDTANYCVVSGIDVTVTVGKGTIRNYTKPTAAHIKYPQTLAEATLTGGDTGDIEGVWSWLIPDAQPISEQSGSSFELIFTPTGAYAELYNPIVTRLAVIVEPAEFEPDSISDADEDITLYGEFAKDVRLELTPITHNQSAYLALLRASSRDASGLRKLVLFKTMTLTGAEEAYNGTLTLTSFVGEKRAGETVSAWFFIDGAPVNYVGTVDADGFLVIEGLTL